MGEAGIFHPEDRVELLEGEIKVMAPIGYGHNGAVSRLNAHFTPRLLGRFVCQSQGSIAIDGVSEPEPDFLVLHFDEAYYGKRHATPADVVLLIEVADSSRNYDLGQKRAAYAKAGIVEYWVADLTRGEMIVHRDPQPDRSYGDVKTYRAEGMLAAAGLPDEGIDLKWLFG